MNKNIRLTIDETDNGAIVSLYGKTNDVLASYSVEGPIDKKETYEKICNHIIKHIVADTMKLNSLSLDYKYKFEFKNVEKVYLPIWTQENSLEVFNVFSFDVISNGGVGSLDSIKFLWGNIETQMQTIESIDLYANGELVESITDLTGPIIYDISSVELSDVETPFTLKVKVADVSSLENYSEINNLTFGVETITAEEKFYLPEDFYSNLFRYESNA